MGLIFDLDQTLIDSSIAEINRNSRNWQAVYSSIPNFKVYDGIHQALEYINRKNIPMVIVTSSPSVYCGKVLTHFESNFVKTVCFHDTKNRKPHPDPIYKAIEYMHGSKPILSFGDRNIDITASNAANVISVACNWGAVDKKSLIDARPTYIINNPIEIIDIVNKYF